MAEAGTPNDFGKTDFGMTDLEEALRKPGGRAVRDGLVSRLDSLMADLGTRIKAGLPPAEFTRAQAIAKALAAARAIVVAFPVTP
jgi:hypothetical protein